MDVSEERRDALDLIWNALLKEISSSLAGITTIPPTHGAIEDAILRGRMVEACDLVLEAINAAAEVMRPIEAVRNLASCLGQAFGTAGHAPEFYDEAARAINAAMSVLDAINEDSKLEILSDEVRDNLRQMTNRANAALVKLRPELEARRIDILTERASLAAERATAVVANAEQANRRVQEVASDVESAAGTVGAANLAEHYDKYRKDEERRLLHMRLAAIASFGTAALLAAVVTDALHSTMSWPVELAKLAVTTPIIFFGGYSLREAGHHRDAAQQAADKSVRLKTIRAYTDDMPEEQRLALRLEMGRSVFGPAAPSPTDDLGAKDIEGILGKVAAIVAQVRGDGKG